LKYTLCEGKQGQVHKGFTDYRLLLHVTMYFTEQTWYWNQQMHLTGE